MRILRAITSVNPRSGGPIEGIHQVSRVLDAQGHVTELVCLDAPDSPWLQGQPLKVHALGPSSGGYAHSPQYVPWLKKHAPEYDAVVVHGLWQYTSYGAWRALRSARVPYVLYTHGMLDPWFRRTYPLKHLKKSLYWPWAEHRVMRDARAVCFTSEEERVLARQSFRPYRCREVVVNYGTAGPSGDAEAQRQAFLSRFPALRSQRVLLFLSRLHVKKGCDLLIDAFAQVADTDPTLHLVMAGPDQTGWQARLEQQAARLGVADRITWTGMLSGDLKWGAYHAAEAFVLPSHQENFGIVVAEAMACSCPVLVSDKVNIWREIEDGGAGFVGEDTRPGVGDLLQRWCALPDFHKETMRVSARRTFEERFEIRMAASSLLGVLESARARDGVGPQMTRPVLSDHS